MKNERSLASKIGIWGFGFLTISSALFLFGIEDGDLNWIAIIILIISGVLLSIAVSLAFGEIAEMKGHSKKTYFGWCVCFGIAGQLMVIALPDRVSERQKQRAENNAIAEREAEKKAEQERIAKVEAAEVAKQARIAAYWDKHPEELKALTEKRAEAEKRLGELTASIFAVEQRKALENVISAINEEISKDREG